MRKHVSISKMMVGGKMVKVKHIDGVPVELQRTTHCSRRYVPKQPVHGCGWLDSVISGIGSLFGGSIDGSMNNGKMKLGKSVASAGTKMTREQLLGEISKSMSSRRGRK
jgi:hypothetical protein